MEWAGAFGDLGTLIPFATGYIALVGVGAAGLLMGFGLSLLAAGFIYRRPMPVQPMKAIGAAAIANPALYGPGVVWGAGLFTGVFWLLVGGTGLIRRLGRAVGRPVVLGIILGLGMQFALKGTRLMFDAGAAAAIAGRPAETLITGWQGIALALAALLLALLLLGSRRFPAMFALLLLGIAVGLVHAHGIPELWEKLSAMRVSISLPVFALGDLTIEDLWRGTVFLALAQLPLTLGNAIFAVTTEHNEVFPRTPIGERKVTLFQGVMNLLSPLIGGVPMCHGAGGLASHIRFGARTGGALIILGSALVLLGLLLSNYVTVILDVLPVQVLGVILLLAGVEIASIVRKAGRGRRDFFVLVFTAGLALWNMGWAFLAGLALYYLLRIRVLKV